MFQCCVPVGGRGGVRMQRIREKVVMDRNYQIKVNGYTFRGNNSLILVFSSHLIRVQLLKKNSLLPRSKVFPLRVGPFFGEDFVLQVSKQEVAKNISL